MMRGADAINDELEVGYDESFERKWSRAVLGGRFVMAAFVAAAVGGLMGRGPFSHRSAGTDGAGLTVDFEPVARSQAATQLTFHVHNDSAWPTVTLKIDGTIVEPMGLQGLIPQPLSMRSTDDGLELTYAVPAGSRDAMIRLIVQPPKVAVAKMSAHLSGRPEIQWTQYLLP